MQDLARSGRQRRLTVTVLVAGTTLFHLATAQGYGYFRDELYYLACSEHLAGGYVDHPPAIAFITWLVRHILGDSLGALRLLPALAAGATVYVTLLITRELGGGRLAEILAGIAVALAPIYLALFSILSMNAFDILLWSVAVLLVVRILRTGNQRRWLTFGLVAGLGLLNKISMLFLGFGILAGLLVSGTWEPLRRRWLWLGGLIAAGLFSPYLLWQIAHGWPTLEFMENARELKNVALSPVAFLGEQIFLMNPVTLPLWLGGLLFLLFSPAGRPYRAIGYAYLAILGLMLTQATKPYYLAPAYPVLLAAGGIAFEPAAYRAGWRWLRVAAPVGLIASGLILAPLAKPLLPVDAYVRFASALGQAPRTDELHELGRLPQFFADMHGWPELAASVSRIYHSLPPKEQRKATIFAQNYGEAGAIDFFGRRYGLPRAISGHNNYHLWGWDPERAGEVVIVIGGERESLMTVFDSVELAGRASCQDCMPYEDDLPLWVARGSRVSLESLWPKLKHYN